MRSRNGGVKSESRVTPSSSVRDPYSFVSQSSSFGDGGAGGNSFVVGVGGGVGGGGGGLSKVLQAMQMYQSPLYMYQGFGGGGR